jgi:hypothetical protein
LLVTVLSVVGPRARTVTDLTVLSLLQRDMKHFSNLWHDHVAQ